MKFVYFDNTSMVSFIQVGTSSAVYPANTFAPRVAERGVTVAEYNTEETEVTSQFR